LEGKISCDDVRIVGDSGVVRPRPAAFGFAAWWVGVTRPPWTGVGVRLWCVGVPSIFSLRYKGTLSKTPASRDCRVTSGVLVPPDV
jgi:hypothetical protein